jgi:hypothetical protein
MRQLRSARHKLDRARAHLAAVEQAITAFLEPLELVDINATPEVIEYRMAALPPVPDAIAPLFGDFLQNARAALDHAVYELSTSVRPDFVRTGFPVVQEEARFEEEAARLIPHLPDRARQVVRNFQPFAWGAGEYDLLASLHELAAIDRHREVALFAAVVEITGVGWKRTVPREEAPDMTFYRPAVKAGEVVLRLPSVAVEPDATFEPRFQGRVVIGEADRLADMPNVDEHSRLIFQRVETVLGYLEQA